MALPTLITVHGTYLKLDGTPEQGLVQFQSKVYSLDSESDTVAVPDVVYGYLDDTGSVSITLPATNDPQWTPSGWTYLFVAQFSASFYSFEVVIPYNAPSHRISVTELVPAQPGGMQLYAPYNHTHTGIVIDPATTVVTETGYNQSAIVGTDVKYARADHSHGTPALPTAGAIGAALVVHSHAQTDITGLGTTLAGKANTTHSHTESDITGLTTDLAAKAPLASPTFTGTVSGVTKSMVGLGNVDNTSDANKPVSISQQAALDAKLPKLNATIIDSTFTVAKSDNTSAIRMRSTGGAVDFDKYNGDIVVSSFAGPGFTGTQTGLQRWRADGTTFVGKTNFSANLYGEEQQVDAGAGTAKFGNTTLTSLNVTGAVTGIDKTDVGLANIDNTSDANKPVSIATANAIAALTKVLVLGPTTPVPGGTPAGTVIVRTTT